MQPTDRDGEIVEWLGRIGGAAAAHLMQHFGMSQSVTSRRMCALVEGGLVGYRMVLHRRPGLYWALRPGLQWRGLVRMQVFKVSPATYEHAYQTATIAVALNRCLPGWRAIYEREIKRLEADEGKLIASVRIAGDPQSMLHRPDLLFVAPTGRVIAVEVELTQKASRRLQQICRGWARARHIDHVYYLAEPRARRATLRAVQQVGAGNAITVLKSGDVSGIVERELGGMPSSDLVSQAGGEEVERDLELWPWEREAVPRPSPEPAPQPFAGDAGEGLLWHFEEE